jgi:hypothetical protein
MKPEATQNAIAHHHPMFAVPLGLYEVNYPLGGGFDSFALKTKVSQ